MNKEEKLKKIVASQPYPLLFATISGAHLYGFASANSDYDVRGSHILSLPEVLRLEPRQETIEISETRDEIELDLVTHDIKKFFALLLKKNGYVLEQLYSPLIIHTTAQHEELKGIAKRCITRYHNHHYLGFARTQWHLFEKESPRRVKPLLYVYRVLLTGIHLMQTGEIEANLLALNQSFKLPYISDLIARKVAGDEQSLFGDVNLDFYQSEYNRLCQELLDVSESSWLPSAPLAKNDLNDLLVRVRLANG